MFKRDNPEPRSGGDSLTDVDGAAARDQAGFRVTRRGALIGGSVSLAGLVGVGGLIEGADLALDVPAADAALPDTTAPEQLRMTFGIDPATEMTASWSAPGTAPMPAPMPAPMFAYSKEPITADNPGAVALLPDPGRWISPSRAPVRASPASPTARPGRRRTTTTSRCPASCRTRGTTTR